MDTLWQDIRFGMRTLRKAPGFTAIAVLALALGIGATTAIFSVADAFLFKPIHLPDPEHLVVVGELAPGQVTDINSVAPANFRDWKEQATSFEGVGPYSWDDVNLTSSGGLPEKVQGFQVGANFFTLCGVQPILGRTFVNGEDQPGHDGVVVLTQKLWERRFGSDPNIIGQTIHLYQRPYTVIGVMPRSLNFPMTVELWLPEAITPDQWQSRDNHSLMLLARLKPGVSVQSADAEMKSIARRLADAYPKSDRGWSARVMDIRTYAVGDGTRTYTFLLMGSVLFVLLIVCANVANLQFVRGASRQKEIAIRGALGGGRWRVMRQLLTESILVAMAGAALGLVVAKWSINLILAYMPAEIAKFIAGWDQIHLDWRAVFFTLCVAALAGVVAGVLPAFEVSRLDLNEILKEGGRSGASGHGRHRLRDALVVVQVSLAIVLLICSSSIARGFNALIGSTVNINPESVLTMQLMLPDEKYAKPSDRVTFYSQMVERMQALPGAQGVVISSLIPYDGNMGSNSYFSIQGHAWRDASETPTADNNCVSAGFFRLTRIPIIQGRELSDTDTAEAPLVALVSRSLARRYFPKGDAIGNHIKFGRDDSKNPWMTIVGIVSDVKQNWSRMRPDYAIYRPYRQAPRDFTSVLIRTTGDPMNLAGAARAAIAAVDPDEPAYEVQTMEKAVRNSMIGIAYVAVMMGVMALMALVLAAIGVYGVMAFTVTQRTYEIGIRMALGAQRGHVLRLVVGGGLLLTAIGLVIGLPVAVATGRLLSSMVYGFGKMDPVTYGGIGLTLVIVTALACWFPARRAMRTDPIIALRAE